MQNFPVNHSPIYNILLIGKNNYLKSVATNALANYLKLYSFESADKLIELVPVNVNYFDREKCENIVISFGKSLVNATKKCHLVSYFSSVIRFIDSVELNSTSSQTIAEIHKQCDTLHGILYLITSEQIQENIDFFINTFKPFLTDLTKSAIKNVAFCFTFNHHPNYDIKALKQLIDRELAQFNFQLRDGQNCFHIDCEPFQLMLASKSRLYKITAKEKKFWDKSWENVHRIFKILLTTKPFSLDELTIANDSKKFFESIEKSITNLESRINCKQEEIETEAKRLKSFDNKNRNLNSYFNILAELQRKPAQIKRYLEERNTLQNCTKNFVEFIFAKLNQDAKELITQFILEFLSQDKSEGNKQIKIESNSDETFIPKIPNFLDSIEINTNIKPDKIVNSIVSLSSLRISGKYFSQNLEFFVAKENDNFDPLLKPIMDLIEPIVQKFKIEKEYIDGLAKLIHEMGRADQSRIRLICFKHVKFQIGGRFLSCHQECGCDEKAIVVNAKGHESVQKCKTIDKMIGLKCTKCKCSWTEHIHMNTRDLIGSFTSVAKLSPDEYNVILNVAAKFDYLLMKHSQTCLNNFMDKYLSSGSMSETFSKLKNEHWENVLKLIGSNEKVELVNIPELCNRLFQLKLSGTYFQNAIKHETNLNNANANAQLQKQNSTSTLVTIL